MSPLDIWNCVHRLRGKDTENTRHSKMTQCFINGDAPSWCVNVDRTLFRRCSSATLGKMFWNEYSIYTTDTLGIHFSPFYRTKNFVQFGLFLHQVSTDLKKKNTPISYTAASVQVHLFLLICCQIIYIDQHMCTCLCLVERQIAVCSIYCAVWYGQ